MISRFSYSFSPKIFWLFCGVCLLSFSSTSSGRENLYWPTSSEAFWGNAPHSTVFQPTISGRWESALFGCIRNEGRRFHEGIDIAPQKRDRRGEPLDTVHAFTDGTIAYVSRIAGKSTYGRYIVIEHTHHVPAVYSLYAHLRSIEPHLQPGVRVAGGEKLGIMGRSASSPIPKTRAHLHFEIGLRLGNHFTAWYNQQEFSSPNEHENHHGYNLVGWDVFDFFVQYRQGTVESVTDYFRKIPADFTVQYQTREIPSILAQSPGLLAGRADPQRLTGWEIDFTWYGLPLKLTPLMEDPQSFRQGTVRILSFNREVFAQNHCLQTLIIRADGSAVPGIILTRNLKLMFGQ